MIIDGSYEIVATENPDVLAYTRTLGEERLFVVVNFSEEVQTYQLAHTEFKETLIHNYDTPITTTLQPYEAFAVEI